MPTEFRVRKYRRDFEDRALPDPVGTLEAALSGKDCNPSITAVGDYREVPYTLEGHLAFEW
jgi:hypothetical protein